MKPLQTGLLCKWVEGLAPGGDCGTILSGSPAASDTSASSLTAPAVSSTQTASEKVESASRGKEKEKESEGEDSEDEDEGDQEQEEDEENLDEEEDQGDGEEDVVIVEETSAQHAKEHGKRATSLQASEAPAAKKSKPFQLRNRRLLTSSCLLSPKLQTKHARFWQTKHARFTLHLCCVRC